MWLHTSASQEGLECGLHQDRGVKPMWRLSDFPVEICHARGKRDRAERCDRAHLLVSPLIERD